VYKERCGNQRIQRRQYAPGLERFMTQKKGWGVRARQSIARGDFILEYTGEICTSAEFEKRMLTRYRGDSHHYCLGLDSKTMIGKYGTLSFYLTGFYSFGIYCGSGISFSSIVDT
jgi:histone-lysine N-methyltransferase ASH1L